MFRAAIIVVSFAMIAGVATSASAQMKVGGGGVDVVGPRTSTAVAPVEGPYRDTKKPGGHTLRCWQNGRLLYEGSGFRGSVANTHAIAVPRQGDGEPSVTVLNLDHAVCILSD
jgi:hypothetical protein